MFSRPLFSEPNIFASTRPRLWFTATFLPFLVTKACLDSERVYFDLRAADGTEYRYCENYKVKVGSGFGQVGLLPDSAGFRAFEGTDDIVFNRDKLYEGVGIAERYFVGERRGYEMRLLAAHIDGKQYGDFVVAVQRQAAPVPFEIGLAGQA